MIKKNKKSIVVLVGIFLISIIVLFLLPKKVNTDVLLSPPEKTSVFLLEGGNVPIVVSIPDTQEERSLGLSGTSLLEPYTGKWFVFETSGMYGFWMKDMNFPLDMVWVDESLTVVGISENVTPQSYPAVFYPPRAIRYVLEINAGESVQNNIRVGTKFKLREE